MAKEVVSKRVGRIPSPADGRRLRASFRRLVVGWLVAGWVVGCFGATVLLSKFGMSSQYMATLYMKVH